MMLAWFNWSPIMQSPGPTSAEMVARLATYPLLKTIASSRVHEMGELGLQLFVDGRGPDQQPGPMMPCAVLFECRDRRLVQMRMPKQSQVLVGAEHQHPLAVRDHPRSVMLRNFRLEEIQSLLLQRSHAAIQTLVMQNRISRLIRFAVACRAGRQVGVWLRRSRRTGRNDLLRLDAV